MRWFILLLIVSSAIAQPVWGPYEVHIADSLIKDLEVCVRGDTADVVWIEANRVLYASSELNGISLLEPFELLSPGVLNHPDLFDAQTFGTSRSVCLLAQETENANSGTDDLHLLAFGQGATQVHHLIDCFYWRDWPNGAGGSTAHGYSLRSNSSLICIGYWGGSVTIFDTWYTSEFMVFDTGLVRVDETWFPIQSPWPGISNVYCFPFAEDSLLVAAETQIGSLSENFCAVDFSTGGDPSCRSLDWSESGDPVDVRMLNRQSLIGVYADGTIRSTILADSQAIVRDVLSATIPVDWAPATAFHPAYGFAALQDHHARLFLARIDTAGQEVQPVGILYETVGEHFIVDADVTITDSGQVVAVWSEYTDWNEGPRTMKIAWTDWTTFLDTPHDAVPVLPQEISLSTYPNPFNATVRIDFDLPRASDVEVTIHNTLGQQVATLFNGRSNAGSHTLNWSPETASGVYLVRLTSGDYTTSQKILYIR